MVKIRYEELVEQIYTGEHKEPCKYCDGEGEFIYKKFIDKDSLHGLREVAWLNPVKGEMVVDTYNVMFETVRKQRIPIKVCPVCNRNI